RSLVSRTGNLLFPEDTDDGWVASIIKALPEGKPEDKPPGDMLQEPELDSLHIDDPVATEADAAFAELAAETAERDAVFAAGWSAKAVPPTPPEEPAPADRVALDALVAIEGADDPGFAVVEDPVAAAADAAFAETGAEAALQDALFAAGWSATAQRPEVPEGEIQFSPEALAALDAVIARGDLDDPALAAVEDPVSLGADAAFAEAAARQAADEAADLAAWSPTSFRPAPAGEEPAPEDLTTLDAAVADAGEGLERIDDPVALAADAAFAETAADVATREAILEARRAGEQAEPDVPVAAAEPSVPVAEAGPSVPVAAPEDGMPDIAVPEGDLGPVADPVAIEADAAFAEAAAELAITEAIFTAQWQADPIPAGAVVADRAPGRGPPELGFWEIEDLVRAEAEIAFEDAAYDLAYSAVDSLVTGEAAALAAFDNAIASGADPEEALAAAIAAAEAVDPLAFGLARTAALPGVADDFGPLGPARPGAPPARAAGPEGEPPREEPETELIADAGPDRRFNALAAPAVLLGEAGDEILVGTAEGFRFFLDPDVITAPGSLVEPVERDDLILPPPAAARNPIQGTNGADFLVGSNAADAIGGRGGDDFIYGDRPTNLLIGVHDETNPLTDPAFSSGGSDAISGGAGSDTIWGGPGADTIHGDVPEPSSALAAEFPFSLGDATPGDDEIHGGDGADTIIGGGGTDTLYGDAGQDNIFGYTGDDVLVGGTGDDTLTGGDGADEFRFEGGAGADALAHAQSLGTDTITDYSDTAADTFGLSDADFGLGAAGTLTDGVDYFESATATLSAAPLDASGGNAGPAIVVLGEAAGSGGVAVYYTDDASAMTETNSYQIADVENANLGQIDAGDFNLRV
ncbi:MAG: hypothetical protein ACE5GT_07395, partial [Rhodospirillales bacterium]